MANGNTGQTEPNLGSGSVAVAEPKDQFGDVSLVKQLQQGLPKYQGYNPHEFKRRLIDDEEYFNEVAGDFFMATSSQQEQQLRQEDPETYAALQNRFKKNFRTRLTDASYVGEDQRETLVNRTLQLQDNPDSLPVEDYKDVISQNRDKYSQFGLLDENGEFIYGNETTPFAQQVLQNSDLHKQLEVDRFEEFQDSLSKEHNVASLVTSDQRRFTEAYTIFNNFGSEGLTQYVNLLQHRGDSEDIAGSFQAKEEAQEYFREARAAGKNVPRLVQEFIFGRGVESGKYAEQINEASYQNGLAPELAQKVFEVESSFRPDSIGDAGEVGIAQFMASTGAEMGLDVPRELVDLDKQRIQATAQGDREEAERLKKKMAELAPQYREQDERFDPEKSIEAATRLLSSHLQEYNYDPAKALAAYNAGRGRVNQAIEEGGENWASLLPNTTQNYISKILGEGDLSSLVFRPRKQTQEMKQENPLDLNNFTTNVYEPTEDSYVHKDRRQVSQQFYEQFMPEDFKQYVDPERLDEYDDAYRNFTYNIWERAAKEGQFSTQDLVDTIKANAEHRTENGRPVYEFKMDSLPYHAKWAADALKQHDPSGLGYNFEYEQDGTWTYRPQRRQGREEDWFDPIKNFLFATEEYSYRNEDGELVTEERVSKDGFWQAWNGLMTVGMAAADTGYRYVWEPMVRAAKNIFDSDSLEQYHSKLKGNLGVDLASGLDAKTDGIFPSAIGEVAPFVEYMAAMFAGGKGLVTLGAKGLKLLTGVKTAADMMRYGNAMKGVSRLDGMALKLSNGVKNRAPWTTGFGVFYSGGAAIEATQPQDRSFYRTIPQFMGAEPTNDLTELYSRADGLTKTAMDIGGSFVFDLFADSVIAGARFGKDKIAQRMGREEFNSVAYRSGELKGEDPGWRVTDQPQFQHDIRRFWHNLTTDLDDLPAGSVGEAMSRNFRLGDPPETMHQFVRMFKEKASPFTENLKGDIRQQVEYLNRKLGDGIALTDEQLDELVEKNYKQFMDNVSAQMYGTLRQGSEDLPLRVAQTLEESVSTVKEFRINGNAVDPTEVPKLRAQGHKLIVKDGTVFKVEDDMWTVDLADRIRQKHQQPMIERVTERKLAEEGLDKPAEELTEVQTRRIDQIESQVRETIGQPVDVDGRLGYVTDFDDGGFTIKTADGEYTKTSLDEPIPRSERRDKLQLFDPRQTALAPRTQEQVLNESVINNQQFRRRVLAIESLRRGDAYREPPETQALPRTTAAADPVERELLGRIDEIETETRNLQRRHRNLGDILDDGKERGAARREITRRINELQSEKQARQRELSRLYIENPQLQNQRIRQAVDQSFIGNRPLQLTGKYVDKIRQMADTWNKFVKKPRKIPYC